MNDIKSLLKQLNYKSLRDLSPTQQKHLKKYFPPELTETVYAKVVEQQIDFSDNNNEPLWTTTICFASIVFLDNDSNIFDKFIIDLKPLFIRNSYEVRAINEIINDLVSDQDKFDQFIPDLEEDIIYDA